MVNAKTKQLGLSQADSSPSIVESRLKPDASELNVQK